MQEQISLLKAHVREAAANPKFIHHMWFVKWHLEIVEKIAVELCEYYPNADKDLVQVMAWMHDYGKILDFDNQYEATITNGRAVLTKLGFPEDFSEKVISYIRILDQKLELDLHNAPIEVQIVSSADGCSHMTGPFMALWWYENSQKPIEDLLQDNVKKLRKDWDRKIVLPEARDAFMTHFKVIYQQSGKLPKTFIK